MRRKSLKISRIKIKMKMMPEFDSDTYDPIKTM